MRPSSFLLGAALVLVCLVLYTSSDLSERSRKQKEIFLREAATRKIGASSRQHSDTFFDVVDRTKEEEEEEEEEKERFSSDGIHGGGGGGGEIDEIVTIKSRNDRTTEGLRKDEKEGFDEKILEIATTHRDEDQDLSDLLKRAATPDKTIIMTAINDAWAAPGSLLDLFFESFHHGDQILHLLNHLVIVAMDQKAFERCKSRRHPYCYFLKVEGLNFASEQSYMKGDYLEMMWRRNRFQQSILELGYNFLFTDVDIVWFRDPFPYLSKAADLIMSADFFVGDPNSLGNYPNGGLLYVKSGQNTIEFYKNWQLSREQFPGKHEQYTFDKIKGELSARVGVKIQFFDTAYFGGFCQHGKDLSKTCTMHANCCIGLENKLYDLRNVLEDWKEYMARINDGNFGYFSWRVPGRCIHD